MTLDWQPLPPSRQRVLTDEIITQLRTRPGEWALIRTYEGSRGGLVKKPVDIEIVWRSQPNPKRTLLYARAKPTPAA